MSMKAFYLLLYSIAVKMFCFLLLVMTLWFSIILLVTTDT